jgi:hypothetical protein
MGVVMEKVIKENEMIEKPEKRKSGAQFDKITVIVLTEINQLLKKLIETLKKPANSDVKFDQCFRSLESIVKSVGEIFFTTKNQRVFYLDPDTGTQCDVSFDKCVNNHKTLLMFNRGISQFKERINDSVLKLQYFHQDPLFQLLYSVNVAANTEFNQSLKEMAVKALFAIMYTMNYNDKQNSVDMNSFIKIIPFQTPRIIDSKLIFSLSKSEESDQYIEYIEKNHKELITCNLDKRTLQITTDKNKLMQLIVKLCMTLDSRGDNIAEELSEAINYYYQGMIYSAGSSLEPIVPFLRMEGNSLSVKFFEKLKELVQKTRINSGSDVSKTFNLLKHFIFDGQPGSIDKSETYDAVIIGLEKEKKYNGKPVMIKSFELESERVVVSFKDEPKKKPYKIKPSYLKTHKNLLQLYNRVSPKLTGYTDVEQGSSNLLEKTFSTM